MSSVTPPRQPAGSSEREAWAAFWQSHGQPWRTEPEIAWDRQQFLAQRRTLPPNIVEGTYPFRAIPLSRADVEWLLATQQATQPLEDGRHSPQRPAPGLDLRGADIRQVDLSRLPLTNMRGALALDEWLGASDDQREMAQVHLERADLHEAHLEGAVFLGVSLARANLRNATLTGADCSHAHLEHVQLHQAHLEGAVLSQAHLTGAELVAAHLEGADLQAASLQGADLSGAVLAGARLRGAHLEGTRLRGAHLEGRALAAQEQQQILAWNRHVPPTLPPADLRGATFDTASDLYGIRLGNPALGFVQLADVRWGNTILSVVAWSQVSMLGDERRARQRQTAQGQPKARKARLAEYETAIRATGQLALVLHGQGLNDQATRFAYRAQLLRRQVLWWQAIWGQSDAEGSAAAPVGLWGRLQSLGAWGFSGLLDLLSGYGYKLSRCFLAYVLAIVGFAVAHYLVARFVEPQPLSWWDAFALSIQSLHGRIFAFRPGDPQQAVNTAEAIVGLLMEALIVAIVTRRILGLDR